MRRMLLAGVIGASLIAFGVSRQPHAAFAVSYPAGWNLVSGPEGSTLDGAAGAIYTLQPGDTDYQSLPATAKLQACWGYWAYFPNGGSLVPGQGRANCSSTLMPGAWAMLGNPSATTDVTLTGADTVLTYSPDTGYANATTIPVGQGAWVQASGEVTVGTAAAGSAGGLQHIVSPRGYQLDAPADWQPERAGEGPDAPTLVLVSGDNAQRVSVAVLPRGQDRLTGSSDALGFLTQTLQTEASQPGFTVTSPPATTTVPNADSAATFTATYKNGARKLTVIAATNATALFLFETDVTADYSGPSPTGFALTGS